MPTIATSFLVDRTSLALGALQLNDESAGLKIVTISPGAEEYDLAEEPGGSASGDDVTHMRRVSTDAIFVVKFSRSTVAARDALITTTKTALRQQGYGISGTFAGEAFSWSRCWPKKFEPCALDGGNAGQVSKFSYVGPPYVGAFMFTLRRRGTISGPY